MRSGPHLTDELAEVQCGWPVWTSSWQRLYCSLHLGHDADQCRALAERGRTLVAVPRLGEAAGPRDALAA